MYEGWTSKTLSCIKYCNTYVCFRRIMILRRGKVHAKVQIIYPIVDILPSRLNLVVYTKLNLQFEIEAIPDHSFSCFFWVRKSLFRINCCFLANSMIFAWTDNILSIHCRIFIEGFGEFRSATIGIIFQTVIAMSGRLWYTFGLEEPNAKKASIIIPSIWEVAVEVWWRELSAIKALNSL